MRVLLQRRYREMLRAAGVTLPVPFTIEAFCANLATARNRPIHLLAMAVPSRTAPCGLWISTTDTDYIVYDESAPATLREHIVLHEAAHIALGHRGGRLGTDVAAGFDTLDPAMVRRVLGRTPPTYAAREERDAERMATLLGAEAAAARPDVLPSAGPTAAVLYRFSGALADDRRWHA